MNDKLMSYRGFSSQNTDAESLRDLVEKQSEMLNFLVEVEKQKMNSYIAYNSSNQGLWQFKHAESFKRLRKYISKLEECFEDYRDRVQYLGVIKDTLEKLKNDLDKEIYKYERRIVIVIHQSIHKCKAEEISEEHLKVLLTCMEILFEGSCTREDLQKVDRMLRKSELNWIVGDME